MMPRIRYQYLIMIVALVFFTFPVRAIMDFTLCDPSLDLETVKVCYKNSLNVPEIKVIDSIAKLKRINARPVTLPAEKLTFLYEEPVGGANKSVSMLFTIDISSGNEEKFPFGHFAKNLLVGQRLMLTLNNEYYLLSYPAGQSLFSTDKIIIDHIPTKTRYTSTNYPGTNWYIFNVLGGLRIGISKAGDEMILKSFQPYETPTAYVIPMNLTKLYEVQFSLAEPVNITDPSFVETLAVCQDDNPRDAEQVKVCRNNALAFTLQRGKLTKQQIPSGIFGRNYVFLFDIVGNKKQVTMFSLRTISSSKLPLFYNDFIDAMVTGKRLALEFPAAGTLYLMEHPISSFISLPKIKLIAYTEQEKTTINSLGSEGEVEFPTIDGGKIFLKRNYGNPPPPFDILALKQGELTPVSLEDQLFTSVSSRGAVTIENPKLGTVSVRSDDVSLSSTTFKINMPALGPIAGSIDLQFKVPKEVTPEPMKDVLFYYHSASLAQSVSLKTASVYRLYKLAVNFFLPPASQRHYFNDTFITTFTGGKELALKFGSTGSSYYLLGHRNELNKPAFFDLNNLMLRTLDGSQTFTPTIQQSTARFTVPEGWIEVKLDDAKNNIYFIASDIKPVTIDVFDTGKNYSSTLTTSNKIQLGISGATQIFLEICNKELYHDVKAASVCYIVNGVTRDAVVSPAKVVTLGGSNYFMEVNGETGENKKVVIRTILPLKTSDPNYKLTIIDWNKFARQTIAGDYPMFNSGDIYSRESLYRPIAKDTLLSNFALQEYQSGLLSSLRNGQEITPITFNGTFVLYDQAFFATQELSGASANRVATTTFTLQPYVYLPENKDKIMYERTALQNAPFKFATALGGGIYSLKSVVIVPEKLVHLTLIKENPQNEEIISRTFAERDLRNVMLDNISVEIKVDDIQLDKIVLSIART